MEAVFHLYMLEEKAGTSLQRNVAIGKASGDILFFFFDDDVPFGTHIYRRNNALFLLAL